MKRNHERSPDKRAFSVALPKALIEELGRIAKKEHRSRNGQIELFLKEAVEDWLESNEPSTTRIPTAGGAPHGARSLEDEKSESA